MALTIVAAEASHWLRIWPIVESVVRAGDTYCYDPNLGEVAARADWMAPAPSECWVGLDGDDVLGTYHLAPNHDGPGAHVANASYMVGAAARRRGVGRALVEHSLRRAKDAGYLAVQFNAVAASNVHAIRLYEDLGFATIGRVPRGFRHPQQGLVDLVIMHRDV